MSSEPVAKRVYVTLPDTVADDLQIWAERRDQPLATVAAIAIELYLERLKASGDLQIIDDIREKHDRESRLIAA